tara:strand:- start:2496 stop:3740 length:1245 start_codon:yes stop_codon:yes gene_type:complete
MTLANANPLFQGIFRPPSFNQTIYIKRGDDEDRLLRDARTKIRRALRTAFSQFAKFVADQDNRQLLLEDRSAEVAKSARGIESLDVRFLTQGSHAYGTLIRPGYVGQEIDLDDGVYVPMPFLNGQPAFSSKGLFALIERALSPLVEAEGWTFKRKRTCIRIILTGLGAHIDLPLYAVDQGEFTDLRDRFRNTFGTSFRKADGLARLLQEDQAGRSIRLSGNGLLLAHRDLDWYASDPQGLHDWFEGQVDIFGEVLRRLSRYGKAWRDVTLGKCDLSSLALMVIACETLEELGDAPSDNRDDEIVLAFANALPSKIRQGGLVWREGEDPLDEDWSSAKREEYAAAADAFAEEVQAALNTTYHGKIVVDHLRSVFGERFPNTPDAVKFGASNQAATILSTAPSKQPSPDVGTSTSG